MTTSPIDVESGPSNTGLQEENLSFDSNQISTDEQLSQIIDSINLPAASTETSTDEAQSQPANVTTPSETTAAPRSVGQSEIGAKIAKKLETLAATSKDNKQTNGKAGSPTVTATATPSATASTANSGSNNESESRRNVNKIAKNILKSLTDPDPQKNLLTLATKVAELQEQNRLAQSKTNEIEKRSVVLLRERDQVLLENSRITAAKTKLESLCRELHRHNQQIREESTQRQRDDEVKRRELATKFQTTIDEIASQLSSYSEKSTSLREQNVQLSEQLANVVKEYELREKEIETALKKKELELRLTEANLEQSHTLLNERTELIKQERQVSEAERLVLYKKCEELASSELTLRSQLGMYSERYQEFQGAIQQSSQMVTSCHTEIEKMGKRIKKLEKERDDFRHRCALAEQNHQKANQDYKLLEKEKRQLETKFDKLDKLSRALQQERIDLQTTIRNLSKTSGNASASANNTSSNENENDSSSSVTTAPTKNPVDVAPSIQSTNNGHGGQITETDGSVRPTGSDNLYDSELGRMAKTVD